MKVYLLVLSFIFLTFNIYAQSKTENDIESLLVNAKKGVYWALANLQGKKTKFDQSLIDNDKLIAKVKVSKELNGVRIESTGYYETNELTLVLYRSREGLIKDGYIKKGDLDSYSEED
ncbi:MAG: hypothetical protein IH620_01510 [Ignavibacterium sp.]|nr:hypothetical protein [Ignavibacterium sp.]